MTEPTPRPQDATPPPPAGAPAPDAAPPAPEAARAEPPRPAGVPAGEQRAPQSDSRDALLRLRSEVGKVIVGQDQLITGLVISLLCEGHAILEGAPGVAKTLMVRTLARTLGLDTSRVQFTPDLMPGDITGTLVYDARSAAFSFREGPVFTNLLLADEINRTPPKTQSALLEAMEERQVTTDGEARALPNPFLVIATENPIEFEGTYPLPEAQLDRFLLKLVVPMPERDAEISVVRNHAAGFDPRNLEAAGVEQVVTAADIATGRDEMRQVRLSDDVAGYIVDVCRATREAPSVAMGVSPRGATALMATARAWAWLRGSAYVSPDDVKALATWTLAHRIKVRAEAELEGVDAHSVLASVLASVPVPR